MAEPKPGSTSAILTAVVLEDMKRSGMDHAEAEEKARETVKQKREDTIKAVKLCVGILLAAALADYKGTPTWVTLPFASGGIYWAATGGDKEYSDAFVKRLVGYITDIRKAFGLGGS